eukprot:4640265-Prymnesium_polylepis.1
MSMLTSTVWYAQLAVSPSIQRLVRWLEPMHCVGGGSRGCRRRVPSSFCGRGGPGMRGQLGMKGLAYPLPRHIGGRHERR